MVDTFTMNGHHLLLQEIEEGTLVCLRENHLPQTASDLQDRVRAVWEAMEPLLVEGANPIYAELGLERRDEEPEEEDEQP